MSLPWWAFVLAPVASLYVAGLVWFGYEVWRAPLLDENYQPITEVRSSKSTKEGKG